MSSLLHWFFDSLVRWYSHSLSHWFIDSLVHWLLGLLFHWIIDSLVQWLTVSLFSPLSHWLVDATHRPLIFCSWLSMSKLSPRRGPGTTWYIHYRCRIYCFNCIYEQITTTPPTHPNGSHRLVAWGGGASNNSPTCVLFVQLWAVDVQFIGRIWRVFKELIWSIYVCSIWAHYAKNLIYVRHETCVGRICRVWGVHRRRWYNVYNSCDIYI